MPEYMLLLRQPESTASALAEGDLQTLIAHIQAWHERLNQSQALRSSGKLADGEGRVLRAKNDKVLITDGPYSETKEVLGGYFIIEVADYEAALGLAKGCPILALGGSVEIRALEKNYRPGARFGEADTQINDLVAIATDH